MKMLNITINGKQLQVAEGTTVLNAAKEVGVHIPTLCHMDLEGFGIVNQVASCRVCVVEVEGRPALAPSCAEKCFEGMVVKTDSIRAITGRRMAVELLLSNHPKDCLTCTKNLSCELQSLANELNVREIKWDGEMMAFEKDTTSKSIVKDPNKCVMCRRCETMCNTVQTCGILSAVNRGFNTFVGPAFNMDMADSSCTFCGQCVAVCPTAALTEVNDISKVWSALMNPKKHVMVQVAPAIRVAIGEEFGIPAGEITTGKLAASLRKLGFDGVFDTDFAADLTIMEEASELVHRLTHNGTLPILTSCCPAWVKFFEHQFPDMLDIPSSCKSPQIMFGAVAKTYYAEKKGLNPDDITVVSIMPCLAKKAEAARPELAGDDLQNVDLVLSTREYAQMLKEAGVDFANLEDEDFDKMLGESTGASVIFGATGGVIEAATRTAYEWVTGETLEDVNFHQLRGLEGIRAAEIQVGDLTLNIGIAHGLGNARKLLEDIRDGKSHFHAIEIMACPGGCIGGGGQPYHHGDMDIIRKRQEAIYKEDAGKTRRKSHENQEVIKLYEEFLGKPYGHKAHELLHTAYQAKEKI
ncbi:MULTISPECIES: NADH-dependent [FeFe] hydrogenase, group A6 [unclassified Fusibacter]|uniref:NADH-dependent [FeFe] hydrogenase, group A6 n=1 Tax=unclassified Fusibacter TaxID=2624464 RepID=UPI0010118E19|nr:MULTISPECIES: NADH-dependent [FeFe] hydrogenase, group A6 [unclassified Fusibacter]MCK8058280.1 NADH-dependent [FeFe] hydrogenase, group A6 [Fusibacter sp. A2]NPE20863.1 4Fe-4S binding protein [Fusibacter sp. A1]RXV63067.1 NADH:ubiquinone oxidoreductase [Fusibacter sp. A1]